MEGEGQGPALETGWAWTEAVKGEAARLCFYVPPPEDAKWICEIHTAFAANPALCNCIWQWHTGQECEGPPSVVPEHADNALLFAGKRDAPAYHPRLLLLNGPGKNRPPLLMATGETTQGGIYPFTCEASKYLLLPKKCLDVKHSRRGGKLASGWTLSLRTPLIVPDLVTADTLQLLRNIYAATDLESRNALVDATAEQQVIWM